MMMRFSLTTLALLLISACATSSAVPEDSLPLPVRDPASNLPAPSSSSSSQPDPESAACKVKSDCPAPKDLCSPAQCLGGRCVYEPIKCGLEACMVNACDPADGTCKSTPMADDTDCLGGLCSGGQCKPAGSCFGAYPQQFIHCGVTRTLSTNIYPDDRVTSYACASGEIARETAMEFDPSPGQIVTVSLKVTGADTDLDLIVLDGSCGKKSKCMNPTNGGGDFAGITTGTGTESVTFTATSTGFYYVVVDGKVAAPTNFEVSVTCK